MDSVAPLKLSLLLFLASISLVLVPFAQATNVKYCDKKGGYPVKVRGVKISPNPVVPGKQATFNISASTGKVIDGGKLVIEVSFLRVPVHTEKHDLSEEISCPIAVGNFVLSHTQTLPVFTPHGPYTLKMKLEDDKNQLLTCISFDFKIGSGSQEVF
ncbi:putative phosphatidylglycerol/phosphatidylinositol transfer protein DDB_G0282179 isoform X1 [Juglans microcarpa x Juglans regia]|uniref:putative phosphatidylglycerol/phosphatidylinositol transfer protein DDB_G0282179 isoform X1 n=1 Tax=Juglans microcarpa x Juglans regia TaxID=2249226 RepID=UPI001B7EC1AC|nr:putative phosphatidylglycerol/phosphatidylinositol transfer protein DDB_G0282179 isoform X1 [Juglans microcarpa x Juglans regia]